MGSSWPPLTAACVCMDGWMDVTSLVVRPDASSSSSSSGGGSIQQLGRKGAKEGGHDAQTQLAILHTSSAQIGCVTSKKNTHTQQGWNEKSQGIQGGSALVHNATRQSWAKMVKLGNNFAEKNNGKAASEDGFDTIPLITPLDASQLQFPPTDKVVVKTKAEYDGESKKGKLRSPKIAEFSISIIEGVSERLKVTLLVICALAFLVCVGFLVVYKLYQYDRPCPDSFIYVQGHCMPTVLYGNYPPQGPRGRGRLFTLINHINHYNMAKQTITRSVSPWVTIMSEEKVTQQEMETAQKLA